MLSHLFHKLFQNKNQIWTFYAQIARLLSGFAFIGLLSRMLSTELLGTWYIFISIFGVASLIEMGLGQVIGRHAAYLKADYEIGHISSTDFLKFAKVGEQFYFLLSLVIGVIAFSAGYWWLELNEADWKSPQSLLMAWVIYVLGGVLTILGAFYAGLLNGSGEMWQTQRSAIYASGTNITVLLAMLFLPRTLLIPSVAMMLSQLLIVILLRRAFYKLEITKVPFLMNQIGILDTTLTMINIAKDAVKMFIIMISYQLLTNVFILILSNYLSVKQIGSYGLTMQLVGVVMSISMIWSNNNFFEMAAIKQRGDTLQMRKIFLAGLNRALTVSMLGILGIYFLASPILVFWHSKTNLLQPLMLAIVLTTAWIDFGFTQFSQLLISQGDMRIAYFSLFSALSICGSAIFLFSEGYSLIEVYIARLILYGCIVGIPALAISIKLLRVTTIRRIIS